ncbi:MAG TPA: M56 family metallopeptidase [Magnetospirillaceae bacterium]|nr:M56 family metallopeptidase [Magnetospirillaceae bacterium]
MMLLAEAALRSSLLTAAVWLALKILRVVNPRTQMAAWSGVLLASLAMPLLMRLAPVEVLPLPADFYRLPLISVASTASAPDLTAPVTGFSWHATLPIAYLLVSAGLVVRPVFGLAQSWRLAHHAARIEASWTGGRDVRLSPDLAMPVTVGRIILLPVDFLGWDAGRRQAVMAHEASHAARGDFYLLLVAGLHRALFWISPAAWWLNGVLADLAEINSDAAALAITEDRLSYAQILIDLASQARPASAGVAMARRATVRRRVERILAGDALPTRLTVGRLILLTAGLIPATLAAAGAAPTAEALVRQRLDDQRRPRIAVALPAEALGKFTGYYAMNSAPDLPLHVVLENGHLSVGLLGQSAGEIFPENDHEFFSKELPGQEDFQLDASGRVTSVVLHWNGGEFPAYRLDETAVRAIETAQAERIAANRPQPGGEAALRGHIEQIQRGEIDDGSLAYGMAASIRAMLPQIRPDMVALGPVTAVTFRGVGPDGMDIYEVTHAKGARRWQIRLTREGRIESMWFSPL